MTFTVANIVILHIYIELEIPEKTKASYIMPGEPWDLKVFVTTLGQTYGPGQVFHFSCYRKSELVELYRSSSPAVNTNRGE
jgi:hypothetical protein